MADTGRSSGLQTIFSFFLGLMVTTFVGVGVYTFHPPEKELRREMVTLSRQEEQIRNARPPNELTAEDRARIQQSTDRRNELSDAEVAAREPWGRSTSIILIALATLAMSVSLVRAEQLLVISNGLLLGGVLTMVYGVGWIVATDTSVSRFIVMTVALVITLALGYVRFVRRRATAAATAGAAGGEGLADVERRVRELEGRLNDAATALAHKRSS
jgi:hypothetical protein